MKKFFAVLIIFALIFAACGDEKGNEGDTGKGDDSNTTLRINNQSSKKLNGVVWNSVSFFKENADIIGTWTGNAGSTGFLTGTINLVIGSNAYTLSAGYDNDGGTWTRNGNNFTFQSSQPLGYRGTGILSNGKLTFNILDFMGSHSLGTFELTSIDLDLSITSGANVIKTVEKGSGYVFFKVGSVSYRSNALTVIDKGDNTEFIFLDSTLVVETSGSNTPVTLGGL